MKWGDLVRISDAEIITAAANRVLFFSGKSLAKTMDEGSVCCLKKTPSGSIFHDGESHYSNPFYKVGVEHTVDVTGISFRGNPPSVTDKIRSYDCFRVAEA
ncbi:hypothetical protein KEJ39_00120 [Candidatus Bathyarchaeota archaeon]|nr:hypothetical protein [Candidatus Bathyarchaeota archaeon]